MSISKTNKIVIAVVFSIAMAFLESAVVVYLRYLLYGGGFDFPLSDMPGVLIVTELGRELATLLMLFAVGYMLATTKLSRLAWFMFCFAIWDIFYYVFLYVLLGWPKSIFDWDILFLLPVAWYGPVITPCLVALSMIVLALIIVNYEYKGAIRRLRKREWGTMLIGCGIILYTFMAPFVQHAGGVGVQTWQWPDGKQLIAAGLTFIPISYNYILYLAGLSAIWAGIFVYWRRVHNANKVMF
ncbi:MAG TPA: hypothetical protein VEC12_08970 [Bacteroidia bacterium]|nr:hypothetical protein [Bacteroidia bacterium]